MSKNTKENRNSGKAVITEIPRFSHRKRVLAIVAGVVLLALATVAGLWYGKAADSRAYDKAVSDSAALMPAKQYDLAIGVWERYLERTPPRKHDYEAYSRIGALQQTKRDFTAALASYEKAEKANPDGTAHLSAMAAMYVRQGNKEAAKERYQKLYDNFPQDHEFREAEMAWIQRQIKSLE